MSGSVFGKNFTISTWGESHGEAIGVCVDGCPSGVRIDEEFIQQELTKRKPGQSKFSTQRSEKDSVKILSGVFEGISTGTPILMMVENEDQRSRDYGTIKDTYRPGHADMTFDAKYGIRDYRGGGRTSGRETIGRVAAGAVAELILRELGVNIKAYSAQIGKIKVDESRFDIEEIDKNPLRMPDKKAADDAAEYVSKMMEEKDSVGGIIECRINGLKKGFGEPVFDKLDARLAQAMFSMGSVKGFEVGEGFNVANLKGSENNDEFCIKDGNIEKITNHSGGILGGLSDGSEIVFRTAIKPTPSIAKKQKTVDRFGNETEIEITGRHDPIIVSRAVVVVEAMARIVVLDEIMDSMRSRVEYIKDFYEKLN